ncbi:MAG: putative quinol monooxygenase [Sphingobacteriaceae bacterium]
MITRIVKMHFQEGKADEFLSIFEEMKRHIAESEGCFELSLHQDTTNRNQFFTVSLWKSEELLNKYRNGELFKLTWARVKPLFAEPAAAWSLNEKA